MTTKLNPSVITDDMMYEGNVEPLDYVAQQRITKEMSDQRVSEHVQRVLEDKLWGEIRRAAKTNNTLQSALEQCIIIYKLSKEYKDV
jgi:adenosyl cobinamide kinase/adenosyl cobinamide phosphate guanylyltransferase